MLRNRGSFAPVLILIIAVVVAGGVVLYKSNSNSREPESHAGKLALSAFDVPKLTAPAGWVRSENITDTYIGISYRSPATTPTGDPKAKIRIDVEYVLSIPDHELPGHIAGLIEDMESAPDYYMNFSHESIAIPEAEGVSLELDYTSPIDGNVIHTKSVMAFKDGKRYVFEASTDKDDWSEYSASINAALDSIVLP